MGYSDELCQEGCVTRGPYQTYDHERGRGGDAFEVLYPYRCPPQRFDIIGEGTWTHVRLPESWGAQPECCGDSLAYCQDPCYDGCVWEPMCLALIEEDA